MVPTKLLSLHCKLDIYSPVPIVPLVSEVSVVPMVPMAMVFAYPA